MPKHTPPLTSAQLQNLRPDPSQTIELSDGAVPGLRLRVPPNGQWVWSLNIRDQLGQRRRFPVGTGLSLKFAREQARALRSQIKAGHDPSAPIRTARLRLNQARDGKGTLRDLMRQYELGQVNRLKSWPEQSSRVSSVFATLMERPLLDLTAADFRLAADQHKARSSAAAAIRYVRPILRWGSERNMAVSGIADALKPPKGSVKVRQRTLSVEELNKILLALGHSGQDAVARFILWTACRREEACMARWSHIDFERQTWTIPAINRKNTTGKEMAPLVIPLPNQAIEMLERLEKGSQDDFVFLGPKGGSIQNWNRWQANINKRSDTSGWHRHDLRRTICSMAGDMGHPPHIVEIINGHRDPHSRLASVYNTSRYSDQHRTALQQTADRLDEISIGKFT